MVKLNSQDFLKYESIINDNYFNKSQQTSSIFFDFERKEYYIQASVNGIIGPKVKMKFDYEDVIDEEFKQFFVDSKKFLGVCHIHSEVFVKTENETIIFCNGENDYNLNAVVDPYEFQFDIFEDKLDDSVIDVSEDDFYALLRAVKYVPYVDNTPYGNQTVFIRNNTLFSVSSTGEIFETSTQLLDMDLSISAVNFMKSCGVDCKIYFTSKYERIFSEDLDIIIPKRIEADTYQVANFQSDNFVDSYWHDSFFKVNKSEFESFLKEMKLFYNELPNKIIHFSIKEDNLHGTIESSYNIINRIFDGETISENLNPDFIFTLDAEILLKAFSILEGENVTVMVSNKEITRVIRGEKKTIETPLCNIFMDTNEMEHVVFRRSTLKNQ